MMVVREHCGHLLVFPGKLTFSVASGVAEVLRDRGISMRSMLFVLCGVLLVQGLSATAAQAADEAQLIESINTYRSQVQRCADQASPELPPLTADIRLVLPASGGDLQDSLARAGYPMVNVQAISLSGPRDAKTAMQALQESFCRVLLDPQFVDVGVSRDERDWRIVLARPLLSSRLDAWQVEGRKVLEAINVARGQARHCGEQMFAAATPLAWSATLGGVAETHSRDMANSNYFDHRNPAGATPGDRAELAGYTGQMIGENIAAGQDDAQKVVSGWLASPGHCANLMNPQFSEVGAAYAVDPKSDAGIYWTALFGAP